jgi:anti-sigma regulatory factor (Ser/Thr protein kinase)
VYQPTSDRRAPGVTHTSTVPSPSYARHDLVEFLRRHGRLAVVDDASLLISELVTNGFEHGLAPVSVSIHLDGEVLRVEVTDRGDGDVVLRPRRGARGHGLNFVQALASGWGVLRNERRTTVWFELSASAGAI